MKNILIISSSPRKIERSLGDLNGFVEHLEEYRIAGKVYAANVMDAGLVKNQKSMVERCLRSRMAGKC